MKKMIFSMLLWASVLVLLKAQSFSDEKTFTFSVDQLELLRVHNHYGKVTVKGTKGKLAKLRVKRTIKSANNKKLAAAKEEIYLDTVTLDKQFMFYVKNPDYRLEIDENGKAQYNSISNNWNNENHQFYKVRVETVIELEVPNQTPLYISTHHKDLSISNIAADVLAKNHHGHLSLTGIDGNVQAHTHHGKIHVSMTKIPDKDATFDTHHGSIEVTFPSNLSADVSLKTRHGAFYTDFDYQAQAMPVSLKKGKKGTKYKFESGTNIRIGNGGPKLMFKTYHGSIYLLK